MKIANCNKLISMHDISSKFIFNDIYNFILKYKKRYQKLMDLINSKDKIYFIRKGTISDNKILNLLEIFNNINPKNKKTLILLRTDIKNHYLFNKKVICINFNKIQLTKNNNNWKNDNYAWDLLFDFIFDLSKDN